VKEIQPFFFFPSKKKFTTANELTRPAIAKIARFPTDTSDSGRVAVADPDGCTGWVRHLPNLEIAS
jgi:hypothetical protein